MKRAFLAFVLASFAVFAIGADLLPTELVGQWAPEQSQFVGDLVTNGDVIYISTNGVAEVVAAPPPMGERFYASYNATNRVLTLSKDIHPTDGLTHGRIISFTYDVKAKTLRLDDAFDKEVLKRRSASIPDGVGEYLK